MKLFLNILLIASVLAIGCSKKSRPTASDSSTNKPSRTRTTASASKPKTVTQPVEPLLDSAEAASVPEVPAPTTSRARPIIIVNSRGQFAVSESDLPADASRSILDNSNARAYTPAETKNLGYRFGAIPPRILYVPQSLQKKSTRGTYYVLQKKYWYWKKANGYFYLDDTYYK